MKHIRINTFLLLACVGTLASAQSTYNDTVRTRSWSIHLQAGISNHHGMRGAQYTGHNKLAPIVEIGAAYHFTPEWRLGFNLGYTYLHSVKQFSATLPATTATVLATSATGNYTKRNLTHILTTDLVAEYNLMELNHQRKRQQLNLWVGLGLGHMRGWNNYDTIGNFKSSIDNDILWSEQRSHHNKFNAICIPITLTLEKDVTPELILGITGQCHLVPFDIEHSPHGIWHLAAIARYNWGGRRASRNEASGMMMQKLLESYHDQAQYRDLLRQLSTENTELANNYSELRHERDSLAHENDQLVDFIIELRDERARLREELESNATNTHKPQQSVAQVTPKPATKPTPTPVPPTQPAPTTTNVAATAQPATPTPSATPKTTTDTVAQTNNTSPEPIASQPSAPTESPKEKPISHIGDTCIYFNVNSSVINQKGMATIRAVSEILKANPKKKIFIIGYSSSTGNADYNLRLSQDRIYAVRKALRREGVRTKQILGDRANGNSNMGSSANNRRVSIIIK